jgi:hypothetical protein
LPTFYRPHVHRIGDFPSLKRLAAHAAEVISGLIGVTADWAGRSHRGTFCPTRGILLQFVVSTGHAQALHGL